MFLANLFPVVSPRARANPLLAGENSLWESLGWQNFPTKILRFTSLLQAAQTAGENIAAKTFLPAGRQVVERLTLQGSPGILFFLRCFMLSGHSEVKAEKIASVGCCE